MTLRVVLGGGGTAGHVTPALATAHVLRERGADVRFVGTREGMESTLVPSAGFEIDFVQARPIRGRHATAMLGVPLVVAMAARSLARDLRSRGVQVACVFGGYVSGPLALAARMAGVPLVIHEQNAVPGLANRIASRWAKTVAASVPGTQDRFMHPSRVVVTGNPVRVDLAADLDGLRGEALRFFDLDTARTTLLVFGGSLGAARINDALAGARWEHPEQMQIVHAVGARDAERITAAWGARPDDGLRVRSYSFIARMDLAYAVADVVLSRSGASTIAELCVVGRPSVLVPYPHAAADEQTANARALAEADAAMLIPDAELDSARLVKAVEPLLRDAPRRLAMRAAARSLGRPDAAAHVADLVFSAATEAEVEG